MVDNKATNRKCDHPGVVGENDSCEIEMKTKNQSNTMTNNHNYQLIRLIRKCLKMLYRSISEITTHFTSNCLIKNILVEFIRFEKAGYFGSKNAFACSIHCL